MSPCHESLIWSGLSDFDFPNCETRSSVLYSLYSQTLPCCMKVQVWDYNKSYLEFKVCSFHREVRPSSSLSALLFFFAFPSSLPVPLLSISLSYYFRWAPLLSSGTDSLARCHDNHPTDPRHTSFFFASPSCYIWLIFSFPLIFCSPKCL